MLYAPKLSRPRTLKVVAPSPFRSVTLNEAKQHIRVEHSEDDTYIETLIEAAEGYCQTATDRYFLQTRLEATWDGFAPEIYLPKPPLHPTPLFIITYVDGVQSSQTLSSSQFRIEDGEPAVLRPPYSKTWPSALSDVNSVTIQWNVGYSSSASDVPAGLRHAILMLVGHFYERRLAYDTLAAIEVPLGVKTLLAAHSWGSYR